MSVFLALTLLHIKHSARLWLSASLAAGMSVYEHGLGNGQAAHTHTRARTNCHTARHDEPVPQLSSHRIQRCNTFPRGSFCSLECNHHETNPQIRFLFPRFPALLRSALLCLLKRISLFGWLTQPLQTFCQLLFWTSHRFVVFYNNSAEIKMWRLIIRKVCIPLWATHAHSSQLQSVKFLEFVWAYVCVFVYSFVTFWRKKIVSVV